MHLTFWMVLLLLFSIHWFIQICFFCTVIFQVKKAVLIFFSFWSSTTQLKNEGTQTTAWKLKVRRHLLWFIYQSILFSRSLSAFISLSTPRNIFDLRWFSGTCCSASAVSSNEIEMDLAPERCPSFYFILFLLNHFTSLFSHLMFFPHFFTVVLCIVYECVRFNFVLRFVSGFALNVFHLNTCT